MVIPPLEILPGYDDLSSIPILHLLKFWGDSVQMIYAQMQMKPDKEDSSAAGTS